MISSIFQKAASQYAAVGIAAIPLGGADGKRPLVRNPQRFGIRASNQIASKARFADANVGFWCGPKNGLTVVDIDSTDESEVQWVLDRLGHSPVIARTGSDKYHAYYGNNAEGRHIDAVPGHKIDLLGSGLCVAPPSVRPGGNQYEFIQGGLSDLRRLPVIPKDALAAICEKVRTRSGKLGRQDSQQTEAFTDSSSDRPKRSRNDWLFHLARELAQNLDAEEQLFRKLWRINIEANDPPLDREEVSRIVRSVWGYKTNGRLFVKGKQMLILDIASIAALIRDGELDALALHLKLKMSHGGSREEFAGSSKAMSDAGLIGSWGAPRYRKAFAILRNRQLIEQTAIGGRGAHDPAKYRFV